MFTIVLYWQHTNNISASTYSNAVYKAYITICTQYDRFSPKKHVQLCVHIWKNNNLRNENWSVNCAYNVQSYHVKIVLYFLLLKYARHFFYLDGLLDQTCKKPITMIISESRKAILPIFCLNLRYCQYNIIILST